MKKNSLVKLLVRVKQINIRQVMSDGLKMAKQDRRYLYSSAGAVILVFLSLGLLLFKSSSLPSEVPLLYSRPWGESQLVSPLWLLTLPLMSLLVIMVNFFWSLYYINKDKLLSQILSLAALIFAFLTFYTLTRIIFLIS